MGLELRKAVIESRSPQRVDRRTPTLLHALCDCIHTTPPVPMDLLEIVFETCPHLLSSPTMEKSPLSMLLDRQAAPRILECLLRYDTSRGSLYRHDQKNGDTPLLQAIKQQANEEVIMLLVSYDTTRGSLLVPSKKRNRVPLYYVVNHELSFLDLEHDDIPDEMSYMLLQTYQALRIQRGELPPRSIPPRDDIEDVIDEDDGSDSETTSDDHHDDDDADGRNLSDEERSMQLLRAVLACAHLLGDKNAVNLVRSFVSRITDVTTTRDKLGNTILHHLSQATYVFAQSALLEGRLLVNAILELQPDSMESPNVQGDLPLHVALKTGKPWVDVIATLINACPETATARNSVNGRLPLHLAILHYPTSESNVIRKLFKSFPGAINLPDPMTRLLPFHLAAMSDNRRLPTNDLDQISDTYFLLRASPEVLSQYVRDND